jgi:hypothetical protein
LTTVRGCCGRNYPLRADEVIEWTYCLLRGMNSLGHEAALPQGMTAAFGGEAEADETPARLVAG